MHNKTKKILLVYFSGTGGVKRIAAEFIKQTNQRKINLFSHSLDYSEYNKIKNKYNELIKNFELLILIYPVHALDAPEPVYDWIKDMQMAIDIPAVLISVSGGGEVWPNTSCRVNCKRALKKKGFNVFYEKMMIMPSNVIIPVNDHLAMHLINIIPEKVNKILNDILSGKKNITRFKISSRILLWIPKLEKKFSHLFGSGLMTNKNCSGCGWCAKNCPRDNIKMDNKKPVFDKKCIICLKCVFGCPENAIFSRNYKFIIMKEGFNLDKLEKRMKGVKLLSVKECCRNFLFIGLKKYLEKKD